MSEINELTFNLNAAETCAPGRFQQIDIDQNNFTNWRITGTFHFLVRILVSVRSGGVANFHPMQNWYFKYILIRRFEPGT